ncbi:hypothetical protein [Rubrobacter aplysinae]|uniref:hypothetical protein n=1 Tax=Rubrobacter aplysinae TaxID=909625 RepID=UPI00069FAB06|nr:hypothetical protein [Rubrobacter aplysinae]
MDRSIDDRKGYTEGGGGNRTGSQGEESQAKQQSKEVARQGQQQASYYAGEARQRIEEQLDTQKERASGELSGISKALRQTGSQLREQNQDSVGQYAEQAATQTDRLSEYLHDKRSDQLIGDVEDFARSRPSVFLGGALVLGVAAARFLKSSSGGSGGSGQGGSSGQGMSQTGSQRSSQSSSQASTQASDQGSRVSRSGTGEGRSQ